MTDFATAYPSAYAAYRNAELAVSVAKTKCEVDRAQTASLREGLQGQKARADELRAAAIDAKKLEILGGKPASSAPAAELAECQLSIDAHEGLLEQRASAEAAAETVLQSAQKLRDQAATKFLAAIEAGAKDRIAETFANLRADVVEATAARRLSRQFGIGSSWRPFGDVGAFVEMLREGARSWPDGLKPPWLSLALEKVPGFDEAAQEIEAVLRRATTECNR